MSSHFTGLYISNKLFYVESKLGQTRSITSITFLFCYLKYILQISSLEAKIILQLYARRNLLHYVESNFAQPCSIIERFFKVTEDKWVYEFLHKHNDRTCLTSFRNIAEFILTCFHTGLCTCTTVFWMKNKTFMITVNSLLAKDVNELIDCALYFRMGIIIKRS